MKKRIIAAALSLAALNYGLALATDSLVSFDGGAGVDPIAGVANGVIVTNVVHGVPPGGRPWSIQKLKATIRSDGRISVRGEGLVLAANDVAGTRGAILQVAATLFCGADAFTSPAANISLGGDFEIRGTLNPPPPAVCNTPTLLIRNATNGTLGAWFAVGTLEDSSRD